MKTRRNVVLGSIAGAVAIHLVFLACGTPVAPRSDAGRDSSVAEMMGDVVDRETSTADAQGMPTPMEAQCSQAGTRTIVSGTTTIATTTFFAEVPSPRASLSQPPRVQAWACDYETLGVEAGCVAPQVCTDSGFRVPTPNCTETGVTIAEGRVIISCGYRQVVTPTGSPSSDYGQRARRVFVFVD